MRLFILLVLLTVSIGALANKHRLEAAESARQAEAAAAELVPTTRHQVAKQLGSPTIATHDGQRWTYTDKVVVFDGDQVVQLIEPSADDAPTAEQADKARMVKVKSLAPQKVRQVNKYAHGGGRIHQPRTNTRHDYEEQRRRSRGTTAFGYFSRSLSRPTSTISTSSSSRGTQQWWR